MYARFYLTRGLLTRERLLRPFNLKKISRFMKEDLAQFDPVPKVVSLTGYE